MCHNKTLWEAGENPALCRNGDSDLTLEKSDLEVCPWQQTKEYRRASDFFALFCDLRMLPKGSFFMSKEGERTFIIAGKEISESEIPQVFNLSHVLNDFRESERTLGREETVKKFRELLEKQLITFIQEQVVFPLSPRLLYKVVFDEQGIQVLDEDYPTQPDIVKRAEEGWLFAAGKGKHGNMRSARYAEIFVQRYLREYQQTKLLVENYLAEDPLLSLPFLKKLAEETSPMSFVDAQGQPQAAFTSPWYALAMPASAAHKGGGSYFNVYRLVAISNAGSDEVTYLVETQGYYHRLGWKKQVKQLLNIDQTDQFDLDHFDEEQIMMRIIRLSEEKNNISADQLLIKIGVQAGDRMLPMRIFFAQRRQKKQEQSIDESIQAILEVLDNEKTLLTDKNQEDRLKIFFEAIGNPLLLNKNVPGKEIVRQYKDVLLKTGDRSSFILSLAGVIPSILTRVGGFGACGMLSAGGLFNPAQGGANGFGGLMDLHKDGCMTCPRCHQVSFNPLKCTNCSFERGMSLTGNNQNTSLSLPLTAKHSSSGFDRPNFSSATTKSAGIGIHLLPTNAPKAKLDNVIQFGPKETTSGGKFVQSLAA